VRSGRTSLVYNIIKSFGNNTDIHPRVIMLSYFSFRYYLRRDLNSQSGRCLIH